MLIGKSYRPLEFLHWTRRKVYILTASAMLVIGLYQLGGFDVAEHEVPLEAELGKYMPLSGPSHCSCQWGW